jgi:SAM-dependent methyltransferase
MAVVDYFGRPGASPVIAALFAAGVIRAGHRVLDVGCGDGVDCMALASWGVGSVTGLELDVDFARRSAARRGYSVRFCEGSIVDPPAELKAGSFDVLIDTLTWNCVERDGKLAAYAGTAWRLLSRGGLLVIQSRQRVSAVFGLHPAATFFPRSVLRRFDFGPAVPSHIPEKPDPEEHLRRKTKRQRRLRRDYAAVAVSVGKRRDRVLP